MHSARAPETWRKRGFWPGLALSVPGAIENARQVAEGSGVARVEEAPPRDSIGFPPSPGRHGTGHAKDLGADMYLKQKKE